MHTRTLLLGACLVLFTQAQAQTEEKCKEPDLLFEGILADNSDTRPVVRDLEGDMPQAGDRGDLYKKFEEKLFGGIMTGWISIGYVEVVSASAGRCTLKVLEKKASVKVDGKNKNLFVAGRTVKFERYSPATPRPFTELYEDGNIKSKGFKICGKPVGQIEYFYENGNLQASFTLDENGQQNGPFKRYYPNGTPQESGNYTAGKRNGTFTSWYSNGNRMTETHFINDVRSGAHTEYEANGDIDFRGSYDENGKESGLWQYYKEGRLEREGTLRNNQENGTWKFYDEKGNLKRKGNYHDGERHGEWTEYYPDGSKKALANYYYGYRRGLQQWFYPNGNLKETYSVNALRHSEGPCAVYYENGQLQLQATKDGNGEYHGEMLGYHPDGRPMLKGSYEHGKKTGVWFKYDEKGKKVKEKF